MSPTRKVSDRPMGITGRLPIFKSRIAMSVSGSWPTTVASAIRPSASCTRIESAPAITCWFVTMVPIASTITPEPKLRSTRCR
jgi:hypothetical protein